MVAKENLWGLVIVAVAAIAAASLVAIQVLAPNSVAQTEQSGRLDRIESQLNRILEKGMLEKVGGPQLGTSPAPTSPQAAEFMDEIEARMMTGANRRMDEIEERLEAETNYRIAEEEAHEARESRRQQLSSAVNDPILRKKYADHLVDRQKLYNKKVSETFQNEVSDPLWAGERMSQINAAFSSPAISDVTMLLSDCRTSMCRVDYSVATIDRQNNPMLENEILAAFSETLGDITTNVTSATDSSGNITYEMYLFRDHASIPNPEDSLSAMSLDEAIEHLNANY